MRGLDLNVAMSVGMASAVLDLLRKAQADMDERLDALTVELFELNGRLAELMSKASRVHLNSERGRVRAARYARVGSPAAEGEVLVAAGRRDRVAGSRVGRGRVACDGRRHP
jgi:hypothetical protein